MKYTYNSLPLKMIRQALKLTRQELSGKIGISLHEYVAIERGKLNGHDFLSERMLDLYGIDLPLTQQLCRVIFRNPDKVKLSVFVYLTTLDIRVNGQ